MEQLYTRKMLQNPTAEHFMDSLGEAIDKVVNGDEKNALFYGISSVRDNKVEQLAVSWELAIACKKPFEISHFDLCAPTFLGPTTLLESYSTNILGILRLSVKWILEVKRSTKITFAPDRNKKRF